MCWEGRGGEGEMRRGEGGQTQLRALVLVGSKQRGGLPNC